VDTVDSTTSSEPLFALRHMSQTFGSFQALYEIDLTVYTGESIAH
jgi:hypothetical protein